MGFCYGSGVELYQRRAENALRHSPVCHAAFHAGGASQRAGASHPLSLEAREGKSKTQEQTHSTRIEIGENDQTKPNYGVLSRRNFPGSLRLDQRESVMRTPPPRGPRRHGMPLSPRRTL